jgi:putative endonuclease
VKTRQNADANFGNMCLSLGTVSSNPSLYKKMAENKWIVYLVRCSDNSLYCGVTNDLDNRLSNHNLGKGAKYTRSRRPVKLVGVSSTMSKSGALKLEHRIKQLPANKKIAELRKPVPPMATLKKDLQTLRREIRTLSKKMDILIAAAGKTE